MATTYDAVHSAGFDSRDQQTGVARTLTPRPVVSKCNWTDFRHLIMFDRFTNAARTAMSLARATCNEFLHEAIGVEHMLLGIMSAEESLVRRRWPKERLLEELRSSMGRGHRKLPEDAQRPLTNESKQALEFALDEACQAGHRSVAKPHLLIGIGRVEGGLASAAMRHVGLSMDDVRRDLLR